MIADLAIRPGSASKPMEDWCGVLPNAAVVLDGVSAPRGTETGCSHGTPWYVAQLGVALLRYAAVATDMELAGMLAYAIEDVRREHGGTCDLDHPGSPAATVVMIRQRDNEIDFLALSDSTLVMDLDDGLRVIANPHADSVVPRERQLVLQYPLGSYEHAEALAHMVTAQRRLRNREGGYWVASAQPEVALHAKTGSVQSSRLGSALLLTDGVTRLHEWGILGWDDMLMMARTYGPEVLIHEVRHAEFRDPEGLNYPRFSTSDDATAVLIRPDRVSLDTPLGGE